MTDDLRTRIAAVIRREVPCHPPAVDRIADAVIRKLGLEIDLGSTYDIGGKATSHRNENGVDCANSRRHDITRKGTRHVND